MSNRNNSRSPLGPAAYPARGSLDAGGSSWSRRTCTDQGGVGDVNLRTIDLSSQECMVPAPLRETSGSGSQRRQDCLPASEDHEIGAAATAGRTEKPGRSALTKVIPVCQQRPLLSGASPFRACVGRTGRSGQNGPSVIASRIWDGRDGKLARRGPHGQTLGTRRMMAPSHLAPRVGTRGNRGWPVDRPLHTVGQ